MHHFLSELNASSSFGFNSASASPSPSVASAKGASLQHRTSWSLPGIGGLADLAGMGGQELPLGLTGLDVVDLTSTTSTRWTTTSRTRSRTTWTTSSTATSTTTSRTTSRPVAESPSSLVGRNGRGGGRGAGERGAVPAVAGRAGAAVADPGGEPDRGVRARACWPASCRGGRRRRPCGGPSWAPGCWAGSRPSRPWPWSWWTGRTPGGSRSPLSYLVVTLAGGLALARAGLAAGERVRDVAVARARWRRPGGAVGSVLRWQAERRVPFAAPGGVPGGTLVVNVAGSSAARRAGRRRGAGLGAGAAGLRAVRRGDDVLRGSCLQAVEAGRLSPRRAAAYLGATFALGLAVATLGWFVGALVA